MPARLHPEDLERLADLVAERVVEQLATTPVQPAPQLVDATTLARRLGVDRSFIYEHADELGAIRLGEGPRARLRFDVDQAAAALTARQTGNASPVDETTALTVVPGRRRKRSTRTSGQSVPDLLPIRGQEA
jgi:hypothetical protein